MYSYIYMYVRTYVRMCMYGVGSSDTHEQGAKTMCVPSECNEG